jgi:ribosomal protein S7
MTVTIRASQEFDSVHELNVANSNFATLWASLGLDTSDELMGSIDAQIVNNALNSVNPDLMIRETVVDGNMITCGITQDQVERYVKCMRCIVDEAIQTTGKVYWS